MADGPTIAARFLLDPTGKPAFKEGGGLRHYQIALELKGAPQGAYAATFELDPTYYDPVRSVRPDGDGAFRLETTSYGDYVLTARVDSKAEEATPLRTTLARALHETYANDPTFEQALRDISEN